MDSFERLKSLVGFPVLNGTDYFYRSVEQVRCELGENKFLLNKYLSEIFEILKRIDAKFAASSADKVCLEILNDCYKIFCPSSEEEQKGKYYYLIEKYISENSADIKNPKTKAEYYATQILLNNLKVFEADFLETVKGMLDQSNFDKLNRYYRDIEEIVGEKLIEYLNDSIYESFLTCTVGMAFIGQITSKCFEMFTYSDRDSSKRIFEIILENKCDD